MRPPHLKIKIIQLKKKPDESQHLRSRDWRTEFNVILSCTEFRVILGYIRLCLQEKDGSASQANATELMVWVYSLLVI